jgi:hypothetical protein
MFSKATFLISLLASSTAILATPLDKRYTLTCGDNGGGYVNVGEAQNCVDYLRNKGTTACTVSGENVVFCTAGTTKIYGSNINLVNNPTSNWYVSCSVQFSSKKWLTCVSGVVPTLLLVLRQLLMGVLRMAWLLVSISIMAI